MQEHVEFNIRKATPADLPRMMDIFAHARTFMTEHGNPRQWAATNWPPQELIQSDIAAGKSYVCTIDKDHIVGTFFYDYGTDIDPTYRIIEQGQWLGGETYGVVHRIASSGEVHGVGSFCISWAYDQCGHLRMDTHPDNVVMQNLLHKLGFQRCGLIHIEHDPDPRIAFEKL